MAVDGPLLVNVAVDDTVLPAGAEAGVDTAAPTSASGEIAVVALALSGCVFAPSLVDVVMVAVSVTEPEAGAV